MRFLVSRTTENRWGWSLVGLSGETLASSKQDFPSEIQASAAAVAFSQLMGRASKTIGSPVDGGVQTTLF
jgi:hypothetical protein